VESEISIRNDRQFKSRHLDLFREVYLRRVRAVRDLDRKIMRYIHSYNRNATPIKWPYKDASNRIKTAFGLNKTVH
jgi:hypothetical protein